MPGVPQPESLPWDSRNAVGTGAGPRARGGQQLWEVKAEAAIPDKSWALPHYGYGNNTDRSNRYFTLGVTYPDHAAPPWPSDLVLLWEK